MMWIKRVMKTINILETLYTFKVDDLNKAFDDNKEQGE